MTRDEKITFVVTLMNSIRDDIVSKVDDMPIEWDGWELRHYIKDKAEDVVWGSLTDRSKKRKYNKDVLVNNL